MSISAVVTAVLEASHTLRAELTFFAAFALLWLLSGNFSNHGTGKAAKPKRSNAGVQKASPEEILERRDTTSGQLSEPPNLHHPKRSQLRDSAWVSAAVQYLSRSQVKKSIELYRDAVNAGLDLSRAPLAEARHIFMALITSAIRVGQADEALSLMGDCQSGPGVTCALLSSTLKIGASRQLYKKCLAIYDMVAEDPTLIVDDRSVWSCLLFCALESNAADRCAHFFRQLKACGVPSGKDYGNMVRCALQKHDWREALSLIQDARQAGVEIDRVVYNTALAACVSASRIDEAIALLEEMEQSRGGADVVTYNTLAKGYAKAGLIDQCFKLIERMRTVGVVPSQITFGILLDACINDNQVERAAEVFEEMSNSGHAMNVVLYTTLIKGFAKAEQLDSAMKVFKKMCADKASGVKPDLVTFSILIKANCDQGHIDAALRLLQAMKEHSLNPDEVILNNLLGGCVRDKNAELAKQLYTVMVEGGIRPSSATFSILIRLYAQSKMLDEAVEMLRTQPELHSVEAEPRLFVQLAQACLRDRQGRRAVEVYKLMLERSKPSALMHSSLFGMCLKLNMLETGAEILDLAAAASCRIDAKDVVPLREAAVKKRKTPVVDSISDAMARLGISARAS